jgi:hypothetical protein
MGMIFVRNVYKLMGNESVGWINLVQDIRSVADSCDMLLNLRVKWTEVILLNEATVSSQKMSFPRS